MTEAFLQERVHLGPLGPLPEPFDLVVTRRVSRDCMVRFEGRSYSVPFQLIGKQVEVRGCAAKVQFLSGAALLATHPRNTRHRILIDPLHFEGEATDEVLPPPPLGRMGRKAGGTEEHASPAAPAGSVRRTGGGGPMSKTKTAKAANTPKLDLDTTRDRLERLNH